MGLIPKCTPICIKFQPTWRWWLPFLGSLSIQSFTINASLPFFSGLKRYLQIPLLSTPIKEPPWWQGDLNYSLLAAGPIQQKKEKTKKEQWSSSFHHISQCNFLFFIFYFFYSNFSLQKPHGKLHKKFPSQKEGLLNPMLMLCWHPYLV